MIFYPFEKVLFTKALYLWSYFGFEGLQYVSIIKKLFTFVTFDHRKQSFFQFNNIHMKNLEGVFVKFFALVNVLNEFVCYQNNDFVDVKGQIKWFHLVFDFKEVCFENLLYVSDIYRNVSDFIHFLPVHFRYLWKVLFDLLIETVDEGFNGFTY